MLVPLFYTVFVLGLVAWGSVRLRWITPAGAAAGILVALGAFLGGGSLALVLLGLFFLLGSLTTKWKKSAKEQLGVAQQQGGQRSVPNVLANGLAPAFLGWLAWWLQHTEPWVWPMLAAAVASATSDTVSSELGSLYGRQFWDVRSGQRSRAGADGVVSIEGTVYGALASALIGLVCGLWLNNWALAGTVALCGLLGNFADSLLGAYLQRSGWLNNHTVNFWSTVIAAACAYLLWAIP